MPEQVCVTTAIIGLLAVGGKTIDSLWDAPAALGEALRELRQCRSAAHIMYKTFSQLEAGQMPFPERPSWISVDHLVATLTDAALAVSDLQSLLEQDQQGCAKLSALCARVRWHNLSMTMMMTILKCPGQSDAQNSKISLERRMTRLLSSSPSLSSRLRSLRDIHGIKYSTTPAPAATPAPRLPSSSSSSSVSEEETWSVFSGYTLADIPVLSMIPLPVGTEELRDGRVFYTFDFAARVSEDLVELMRGGADNKALRAVLAKPEDNKEGDKGKQGKKVTGKRRHKMFWNPLKRSPKEGS